MSATRNLVGAARPLARQQIQFARPQLRFGNVVARRGFSSSSANAFRFGRTGQGQGQWSRGSHQQEKRWSSSAAGEQASWFQRMWDSPIGLKTVHFWAPVMKWAIVIAGISDFARPAEKLSLTQNVALTATGLIWTRWCLIIKPKNYLLAAVNFFLGIVGLIQLSRIAMYESSKKAGVANIVEDAKQEVKEVKEEIKA